MSTKKNALNEDAKKEPAPSHQPGQSAFKAILPEEIEVTDRSAAKKR